MDIEMKDLNVEVVYTDKNGRDLAEMYNVRAFTNEDAKKLVCNRFPKDCPEATAFFVQFIYNMEVKTPLNGS
jgi:hypothetical protein